MNPLKVNKIQLGFSEQSPSISEIEGKLSFYETSIGAIRLDQLVSERFLSEVLTVSKSLSGSDYNTISDAIQNSENGDVIVVYSGEYEETLNISNNIHILCMGKVKLISQDATAITVSSSNVSISDMEIKVGNGLGNPVPYCIETSHTEVGNTLTLKNCILDVSEHVNANFLKSDKVSSYFYSSKFKGTGSIEIEGSNYNHFFGSTFPDIALTNIIGDSHMVGEVESLTLVNSSVHLNGSFQSCVGDADSSIKKDVIVGSVVFNGVDSVAVNLSCPLHSTFYVVLAQNISNGEIPVITQKTQGGFTISVSQAINEEIYYTIVQ